MTKKNRIILIYILILLFFLTTPPTILYSQGYRFDIADKKITSTGGLFLKVLPRNANIFLDNVLADKTDFLFGSVLIENLLPEKYQIRIEKKGYIPWEKTLEVKAKQVTDAKNITLILENPEFIFLNKNVENFWFSPDQEKIIMQEKQFPFSDSANSGKWSLKLYNTKKNIKSHLISENEIFKFEKTKNKNPVKLKDIEFSFDSKKVLLKTEMLSQSAENQTLNIIKYFIIELDSPSDIFPLNFSTEQIEDISFHPKNSEKLFLFENNQLKEIELSKNNSQIILENILTYKITKNNIYYLNQRGWIFKTNLFFQYKERLINQPIVLDKEKKYKLDVLEDFVFLYEDKSLYWLKSETKSLKKLLDSVKSLTISPDSKKICCFNNNKIWILFLDKQEEQPKRKPEDKILLVDFSENIENIENIFWWTNHYILFNLDNNIKIMEIDDRDKINTGEFTKFGNQSKENSIKIFWNQQDKKLYVLSDKNLYKSEKLLQ